MVYSFKSHSSFTTLSYHYLIRYLLVRRRESSCYLFGLYLKMWRITKLNFNFARLISCTNRANLFAYQARYYSNDALLSEDEIQRFKEDGAVCLRGKFSQEWLDKIRRGIHKVFDNPSQYGEKLAHKDSSKSVYFNDYCNYQRVKEFSDFVFDSPAGELARQLMESENVVFYHEHVFTKDPGTCFATPWHHDQAYYPLDGWKNCSFWMPLSAVSKENCLKYIKGSHRLGKWFIPKKFETNINYSLEDKELGKYSEMIDINTNHDQYEELSWDLEPGDCIAFHMLTVHGAQESVDQKGRQVLATRWLGDDMVIATRPWEFSPPILPEGFKVGDSVLKYSGFFPPIKPKVHT